MTLRSALLLAGAALLPLLATPAAAKETPNCSAIDFRPVGANLPDGDIHAGMYRAKFGRLEVMAKVQGGQPVDYYLLINGKPAGAWQGEVPKASETCLRSKKVGLPLKKAESCVGSRIRLVIDKTQPNKLVAMFAQDGGDWKFCRAMTGG